MKVTAEFDPKELRALSKDLDKLLRGIGQELASAPKMEPIVAKIKQGMTENAMKFENSDSWEKTKKAVKGKAGVKHTNPIMTTGQLVQDFIFYAGKPKLSDLPKSDEFEIGRFTWADKIRERPTYEHIINQLAIKEGGIKIYKDAIDSSFMTSKQLVRLIMKSPRYPIMDSIVSLYKVDIVLHLEKRINEAFSKTK